MPRFPRFAKYIGIDYSGAEVPTSSLKGLRVYAAAPTVDPVEVPPPPSPRRYWTRQEIAEWLVERFAADQRMIVGIDHPFSFPMRYFKKHGLVPNDWTAFLDDFQRHWPTDDPHMYVDFVIDGHHGNGAARTGMKRWQRLTEERTTGAKSCFRFDGHGALGKVGHAGLPWLRFIRQRVGDRVHFWPFDGWELPSDKSVMVEMHPDPWSKSWPRDGRTSDQHDAWAIAKTLSDADIDGRLDVWLDPKLDQSERPRAQCEGWILGVE